MRRHHDRAKELPHPPGDGALEQLGDLRRHVDGCGLTADANDWILDCDDQLEIRALLDQLIAALSS
ncbi:MAG: hypothetical protein R3244_10895 [Thermoanaerobaculia bacterium]|nr:hypothetical protein [Thermoanaerobaculia bacterium]